jgi:23S rRNA (uracil1939-C5)-methyltransferase
MRKRKHHAIIERIPVLGIASEGKAIARYDDRVIFIPYAVPGDIIDIQPLKIRKGYIEGRAIKFHEYSSDRVESFCTHFGVCGGCKWQILPYASQLRYKHQQVIDQLTRIGKLSLPEVLPILGSSQTIFYRNKLEFTFSNRRWITDSEAASGLAITDPNALGFHIPGRFDKVLNIDCCWLQSDLSNRIRNSIRSFAIEHGYTFFDMISQVGLLRNLIIRSSTTGELMLIVVFHEDDALRRESLMTHIVDNFPEITSLLYVINRKANDTITDQDIHVFSGRDHIVEEMEGLRFKIGAKSFYQTNNLQAEVLYGVVRDFAGLTGTELVYDLYTGTGTIANFLSRNALRVIGIEYIPEAIEDARTNAMLNGLTNTEFYAGDMKDLLTPAFIAAHGRPDVLITDPPRTGMHEAVVRSILSAAPRRIVYVSCNPATQARDLQLLAVDYLITKIQPVDMFPHTHHVENVVLLERKTVADS